MTTFFLTALISLAVSLPVYSQSSFLDQLIGISNTAIFLMGAAATTVLVILVYPALIRKYGNYLTTVGACVTAIFAMVFLTHELDVWVLLMLFIMQYTCFAIIGINLDIFLESVSDDEHTGRIRTLNSTIRALASISTPLVMGYLVSTHSLSFPYMVSALALIPVVIVLLLKRNTMRQKEVFPHHRFRDINRTVRKSKSLRCVFELQFVLQMFYGLMVFYTPIYLNEHLGIPWDELGLIFTIMLTPFIIFQIPAGTLADKYFGEKEITIVGIIIMALSLIAAFATTSANGIIWIVILFASRVGAVLLEAMIETHFFKHVNADDLDFIDAYRAVRPTGWLVASAVSLLFIGIFPLQYMFLLIAIIILLALKPALALPDTK